MGNKLQWTGLTLIMALTLVMPDATTVGAIVMVLGCVLMWLDK